MCSKYTPKLLVAASILTGLFILSPASYAGGAAIPVPADDVDVPKGSQIPKPRIQQTQKMMSEYKVKMRKLQQQQQQQQQTQSTPKAPEN